MASFFPVSGGVPGGGGGGGGGGGRGGGGRGRREFPGEVDPDLVAGRFVSCRLKMTGEFFQGTITASNPWFITIDEETQPNLSCLRRLRIFLKDIEDLEVILLDKPKANDRPAVYLYSEQGVVDSIFPAQDDSGNCTCYPQFPFSRPCPRRVIVTTKSDESFKGNLLDCVHCGQHGPNLALKTRDTLFMFFRPGEIKHVQLLPDKVISNTSPRPLHLLLLLPIQIGSITLDINQAKE